MLVQLPFVHHRPNSHGRCTCKHCRGNFHLFWALLRRLLDGCSLSSVECVLLRSCAVELTPEAIDTVLCAVPQQF